MRVETYGYATPVNKETPESDGFDNTWTITLPNPGSGCPCRPRCPTCGRRAWPNPWQWGWPWDAPWRQGPIWVSQPNTVC